MLLEERISSSTCGCSFSTDCRHKHGGISWPFDVSFTPPLGEDQSLTVLTVRSCFSRAVFNSQPLGHRTP